MLCLSAWLHVRLSGVLSIWLSFNKSDLRITMAMAMLMSMPVMMMFGGGYERNTCLGLV